MSTVTFQGGAPAGSGSSIISEGLSSGGAPAIESLPMPPDGLSGRVPGSAVLILNTTNWRFADNSSGTSANPVGLYDGDGKIQSSGPLTLTTDEWDTVTGGSGGLTVDAVYFLGSSGEISTTAPSASGSFVTVVGIAGSATTLDIRLFAANGPHA